MKIILRNFTGPKLLGYSLILALIAVMVITSCNGNNSQQHTVRLGPAMQYSTNNTSMAKTVIGDLNGDGLKDVATFEAGYDTIQIYYQGRSHQFESSEVITLKNYTIHDIAIADVNNDGREDLIISGETTTISGWDGRVVVFYQNPATGKLSAPHEYVVTTPQLSCGNLAIGDLNSDGRNDIAVLADWGFLSIFYQNPNGTLGPETFYNIPYVKKYGEIHIADMDNDGHNDIIVQTGNFQFAVIKQNASSLPGTLNVTPEYYNVANQTFDAFAVGDLNGDGKNDVVVLGSGNYAYFNIFLQNSFGTLDNPVLISAGYDPPYGLEIADMNGDGLNDIIGDRVNPGLPSQGHVLVWYQSKDHSFNTPADYTFPTISGGGSAFHQNLSVGDVTGDGWPDAVLTWSDEGLFVLPN